ncbi:hypothetical protein HPP92_025373 [Vanilla planifolia]|uniref:K Homology domain-containing protein n=1 Tax=Vanilla planifolia TaxID=51239 RepID=A0A835PIY2_VANPL|nr:hypothetical protein HPP92_025675 [Vanilla planifolia]KAG0454069.1 hypothetical protein HPP92_025373 [Vanilla planifolia]
MATTDAAENGKAGATPASLSDVNSELRSTQHSDHDEEEMATAPSAGAAMVGETKKWPGWPGDSVFRLIVPVLKVGSLIGRKGELIKKLCEETRARIRVLEGAIGTNDRIVLISAKEEQDADISPAMDAVLRVFKHVNGISESMEDGTDLETATTTCSVRLLVSSSQAINLIGKQGAMIKSIQENTGASIRVTSGDELPYYVKDDERVVDIHGESSKVLKALKTVVGHLRKFLVDHGVLPLFEKSLKLPAAQGHEPDAWADKTQSLIHPSQSGLGHDFGLTLKQDSLYLDHDPRPNSQFRHGTLSLYGHDPVLSGWRPPGSNINRGSSGLVTQVTQRMQVPLSYAEDIIGIGGGNIAYIRRTSGAVLTVQETRGVPDEITVELKGSTSQVQMAQQLIQEFIAEHRDTVPSGYRALNPGLSSAYSRLSSGNLPYSSSSSSFSASALGGFGSSKLGTYGGYRP